MKTSNIRQYYGPQVGYKYNIKRLITWAKILKMKEFGTIVCSIKKCTKKKELPTDIDKVISVQNDSYTKAVRYAS